MLKLVNIIKNYPIAGGYVQALKGVNLCFRKNEFVSVLGPSGCGKTTLLNIIGGLDHYTEGDLVINGVSTKEFKDHDWDVYRNHKIGFIFQSYNLIPQENLEENVELALTISGVNKEERKRRARKALDEVGLKDMYTKYPNQLSGGQCQRVAIARALVNEPEILLADEPTGALDSVTSVQIMDLIKKISEDRLVIMVTHNPDLARKYSTRTISCLDGQVIDDTNPYTPEEEERERENQAVKTLEDVSKERAKMSWFTAFMLSAKNLWVKMKRSILTIVASSIGIVGVSAVLAVSSGVTGYIDDMQNEMLSGNPIQVARESYSLASAMSQMTTGQQAKTVEEAVDLQDGSVRVDFITGQLIESAKTMGQAMISNDITQDYVDYIKAMPKEYYQDISYDYGIDISNNIYTSETYDDPNGTDGQEKTEMMSLSGIRNLATAILEQKLAENGYSSYASLIKSYGGSFAQSLDNSDYLLSQYDLVEGKIATGENEIMVVLNKNEAVTDFTLTLLGYYSQQDFLNVVYHYDTKEDGSPNDRWTDETEANYQKNRQIAISRLVGKEFRYYKNDTVFTKSDASNRPFTYQPTERVLWTDGIDLKVVGVIKPKENRQYTSLSAGFYYTPAFSRKFIADNENSELSTFLKSRNDSYSSVALTNTDENTGVTTTTYTGIYYDQEYKVENGEKQTGKALVGNNGNDISSLLGLFMSSMSRSGAAGGTNIRTASLSTRGVGGNRLPETISFYPNSFEDKYLLTGYLDKWNKTDNLTVTHRADDGTETDKTLTDEDRDDVTYTDNLEVVISMVRNIINIVTISLIAFTSLSLVVSTVMIAIITYVSVMERIKEIGVIRSLGGRKKDVSHLFNAETLIIGGLSGVFGVIITYLFEIILNISIHAHYPQISMIANLSWWAALLIIIFSVLLTVIAGFIPSRSAAKKDPVVALRSE